MKILPNLELKMQYIIKSETFKTTPLTYSYVNILKFSELDSEFGDLLVEIANHESSIMMRLIEDILLQSQTVIDLVFKALYIDV